MKTSPIRHPKFEHNTVLHSWMVKACYGNLTAALLLSYLEGKFHVAMQCDNKPIKGWMKFQKFQVKNGCFAEAWDDLDLAIDILKALNFIEIDDRGEGDRKLGENEIWICFYARKINEWLEVYQKPTEKKMELFNFTPFLSLLFLTNTTFIEVEVEKIVEIEKIVEKQVKVRTIKLDDTWIGVARNLFNFWKYLTGHSKSNLQDKYAKMIIDRLKDEYTPGQIAHGIIGLTYSDYHKTNNYDHIQYVVRDTGKLDRLIDLAKKQKITLEHAQTAFDEFIRKTEAGEDLEPIAKIAVNPNTGKTLK